MRRVVYSWYYDIPSNELVSHHESRDKFNNNYKWLLERHEQYASKIGVDYKHFTNSKDFNNYQEWFKVNYPDITTYNIVNFYKIHLMYQLAEEYDEILYLDMDVIPATSDNFFEVWDLSKGYAIMTGTAEAQRSVNELDTLRHVHHVRSPMAKHWNTKCMLNEMELSTDNIDVFNTGIVGINKQSLERLAYFDRFEDTLNLMALLTTDTFYPESFRSLFGYDNETVWGYKTIVNNVPFQRLGKQWHHFMDTWSYIPPKTKLIHCVSKDFDYVREWCEKNNI